MSVCVDGPDVFVSYRAVDGGLAVAHLADRIGALVGPDQVFRDSDSLLPGRAWPPALVAALGAARVLGACPGGEAALPGRSMVLATLGSLASVRVDDLSVVASLA